MLKKKLASKEWIPEILYEEDENGKQETIPLIEVPENNKMPYALRVWEQHRTGRYEPGDQGQEVEVVERDLHLYIDMHFMKEKLAPEDLDKIRVAMGMKPLKEAQIAGAAITEQVKKNVEAINAVVNKAKHDATNRQITDKN
jgi:hypothetical protein